MECNGGAEAEENITANSVGGSTHWMQKKCTWCCLNDVKIVLCCSLRRGGGDHLQWAAVLFNFVYENKADVRRNISSEMIPTIYFTLYELLIRQRQEHRQSVSQYLIKKLAFFYSWLPCCFFTISLFPMGRERVNLRRPESQETWTTLGKAVHWYSIPCR